MSPGENQEKIEQFRLTPFPLFRETPFPRPLFPFQYALQFFPAALQRLGIGPDARNERYFAIERTIVLDDFVPGLPHGRPDIRGEHPPNYLTAAGWKGASLCLLVH
jgi:hypothetical protein